MSSPHHALGLSLLFLISAVSLGEGQNILGHVNQATGAPTRQIQIGAALIPPSSEINPTSLPSPVLPPTPPPAKSSTPPTSAAAARDLAHGIIVVALNCMVPFIILVVFLRFALKPKRKP